MSVTRKILNCDYCGGKIDIDQPAACPKRVTAEDSPYQYRCRAYGGVTSTLDSEEDTI